MEATPLQRDVRDLPAGPGRCRRRGPGRGHARPDRPGRRGDGPRLTVLAVILFMGAVSGAHRGERDHQQDPGQDERTSRQQQRRARARRRRRPSSGPWLPSRSQRAGSRRASGLRAVPPPFPPATPSTSRMSAALRRMSSKLLSTGPWCPWTATPNPHPGAMSAESRVHGGAGGGSSGTARLPRRPAAGAGRRRGHPTPPLPEWFLLTLSLVEPGRPGMRVRDSGGVRVAPACRTGLGPALGERA